MLLWVSTCNSGIARVTSRADEEEEEGARKRPRMVDEGCWAAYRMGRAYVTGLRVYLGAIVADGISCNGILDVSVRDCSDVCDTSTISTVIEPELQSPTFGIFSEEFYSHYASVICHISASFFTTHSQSKTLRCRPDRACQHREEDQASRLRPEVAEAARQSVGTRPGQIIYSLLHLPSS
jgi:hypothetical protein